MTMFSAIRAWLAVYLLCWVYDLTPPEMTATRTALFYAIEDMGAELEAARRML